MIKLPDKPITTDPSLPKPERRGQTMKHSIYSMVVLVLGAIGTALANHVVSTNPADWYDGTWIAPAESAIPNNAEGDMIRYGKLLLTETNKYLGVGVEGAAMQLINSKLSCSNCHLDSGTGAFGNPWAVVWFKYGAGGRGPYAPRSDNYLDMENRINDCMKRSMNGSELPRDSHEMQSMKAYMIWLSTGMQVSNFTQVVGQGSLNVPDLNEPGADVVGLSRAADPVRGRAVYEGGCAMCHGDTGAGVFDDNAKKYIYPSVWGPESFNDGAGMARLRTAVGFVKGNMPYGWANASDTTHQISAEDAWDAMAYVLSNIRPSWSGHLSDWSGYNPANCMPNWLTKRVDGPYEWLYPRIKPDGTRTADITYPAEWPFDQHTYGPWPAMLEEQTALQQAYLAITPRPVYPNCVPFEY